MPTPKKKQPAGIDLGVIERRIKEVRVLVIDEETTGLDWKRDKSIGHVLAFGPAPDDSIYIPIAHTGGGNLDKNKVNGAIKAGLKKNPTIRLVNHNLAFDLKFLNNEGLHHSLFGPLECTMVNACLVDERQRSFSLDACAEFAGVQSKKGVGLYEYLASKFGGEANKNQMEHYHKLRGDDPVAVEYATGDGTSTYQLWMKQQEEIDKQELRQAWEIECRVIRVLHRMTSRGIKIDEERLAQVKKIVLARMEKLAKLLPKDFNVKAPTQMVKFFTEHGHTDWPLTPKGNPSFAEEWLETNEPGRNIIAVRKLRHLDNSFITPLQKHHIWHQRVHTTFNQTRGEEFGTITYRLSSNDPNLQQVHKRDSLLGSVYRSVFVPDKGMTLGTADYAQIEPCLLAHYGSVRTLLDGYLADPPIDAHSSVARTVFGPNFTKEEREKAKRINQAILTGAGTRKIASMVGGDRAESLVDQYHASMPEIRKVQRRSADVLRARGFVRCLLGHRARLEMGSSQYGDFAYKALNRLLQVGNAGILKKSMADIDEFYASEGDRVHLLLNIHDDLVTQFAEEDRHIYNKGLEIMQDFGPGKSVHVDVPIRVDAKDGANWAEATYGIETVKKKWAEMGGKYAG